MGGAIQYVVRKDGQTLAMEDSTGLMDEIQSVAFLNGERTQFLQRFSPVRADNGVYPNGYGLVVVDFDHHWIGTCQGYSDLQSFHPAGISLEFELDKDTGDWVGGGHRAGLVKEAVSAGFIKNGLWRVDNGAGRLVAEKRPFDTALLNDAEVFLQHILNECEKAWGVRRAESHDDRLLHILFEPTGWTFERFEETTPGWHQMATALLDLGFDLSSHGADWDEYVLDYQDKSDEDADPVSSEGVSGLIARHLRQTLAKAIPEVADEARPTSPRRSL
jgi:hypothetical protein